ncbi:hypothetical protein JQX13_41095 [Archangium violaceum]|uniref:hypothetical protein n=1 Tax=Archangium violaceum TaxID=83451 RepID=UPI00193BF7A5|nr:hypothetical protein [Archangium violaceum]QRK06437.1 hypothetical protein JQX13_41095 [Archangium violaceum]
MARSPLGARRMLLLVIATVVLAYLVLCLQVFLFQRNILFPVPPGAREPQMPGATLLRIPGREGSTVYVLHIPAPPGAPTVVHFHGNGDQLADQIPVAWRFKEAGLGFYVMEYPGYGLAADGGGHWAACSLAPPCGSWRGRPTMMCSTRQASSRSWCGSRELGRHTWTRATPSHDGWETGFEPVSPWKPRLRSYLRCQTRT